MNNPYYNSEGYADPTAYAGTKNIIREESENERRASDFKADEKLCAGRIQAMAD